MKQKRRQLFPHRRNQQIWRRRIMALAGLFTVLAIIFGLRTYNIYQAELPSFEQLHNIEPSLNTRVFDRNNILIKEYFAENRALTPYQELPKHLTGMLLASEDQRFYSHWGINIQRVAFVAIKNIAQWKITAGASTVTQQLARMLFLNRDQTLSRKFKEALTAIKLESNYSKNEIIEMYLNQHYFSRGAYGVSAAARLMFDKKVYELDYNDCAILIGMLKGPNINSPLNNPDKALQARNRVLFSYFMHKDIDRELYDSLRNQPLMFSPPVEDVGIAPHFTETIRQRLLNQFGEKILYSGGLKVYTSLDAGLQKAAERAVFKRVDSLRARIERKYSLSNPNYTINMRDTVDRFGDSIKVYKKVQGAFIAIDNSNGDVLAMVGGRSYEESKWNRAYQALRQPGSSFKPFVYTAGIDNGFRTTTIIDDNPIVLDIPGTKQWRPHNFDNKFKGPITIRDGIRLSRNLVAIRLLLKISPDEVIFYARRMGISTPLASVPSLAIGVSETRLIEMVSAYSTFPNQGIHIPYRMIRKIVDRYGKVLEDNTTIQKEEVLSAQTAFVMVDLMKSVVDNGTGKRARWMGFTRPAGGKTGTSDNFADNWFIGYTSQISAGAWIGFDDKTSLGRNQDGSKNGVPVWAEFMMAAHDSLQILDFDEPEGIVHLDVCLESGEIATDRCVDVRNELFLDDNKPTERCHIHPSGGLYSNNRPTRDNDPADSTDERVHF